jgi:hypothetical protein
MTRHSGIRLLCLDWITYVAEYYFLQQSQPNCWDHLTTRVWINVAGMFTQGLD